MTHLFTRKLGAAPGVQLNPLQDNSEIAVDKRDQYFAGMLRLSRGRIDKPFLVTPSNIQDKIGRGGPLGKGTNDYKSYVAVVEALKNGAAGAVLQRLVPAGTSNKYIVVKSGTSITLNPVINNGIAKEVSVTNPGTAAYPVPTVTFAGPGTGADAPDRASVSVTVDKDGAIVGVEVSGGVRFTNETEITFGGAGGSGAVAHFTGVKNGDLNNAKVVITDQGTGYPHPTVAATIGTGAEFYTTVYATGPKTGKIKAVTVAKPGIDYKLWNHATPTVITISGGTGAGAVAKLVDIDNGVITAITSPNAFGDYLYGPPKISIKNKRGENGGVGLGARATATVVDGDIDSITVLNGGSGYVESKTIITANLAINPQFVVQPDLPGDDEPFLFAIKDLECINEGLHISLHCEEKTDKAGNLIDSDRITLRIIDPLKPRQYRYEFIGDLSSDGRDDFGTSTFLPDVVSRKTDNIKVIIGQDASVHKDSLIYGYEQELIDGIYEKGEEKWVTSDRLKYFNESDAALTTDVYQAARRKLVASTLDFAYISSLDTDSIAVLKELMQAAYETNRNLRFDVQGDTVLEAISFKDSLSIETRLENHLIHAFWTPLLVEDPTAGNGSMQMGSATLNIALACFRNAHKDAKGFAPKHYPIMGRNWALNKVRKNIRQLVNLNRAQLDMLARAKINPVIYEDGNYIFSDSLTCADVDVSLRALISVTDMSTDIDAATVRFCNGMKGYPINEAIKQTKDFLKSMFEGAESAGWLVPSNDPDMLGKSFKYDVFASPERPYDVFIVNYWLRYQGTARQIFITQTYTR